MGNATINQFNSFVKNNATIQFYNEFRNTQSWRNKYFETARGPYPVVGNSIYSLVQKLAQLKTGLDIWNLPAKRVDIDIQSDFTSRTISFSLTAYLDSFQGAYIRVSYSIRGQHYSKTFTIRSNSNWNEFNLTSYFHRFILPAVLYPKGFYREVQIQLGYTKEELKTWMKNNLTCKPKPPFVDPEKALVHRLRRKKNLNVADSCLSERELISLFKHPRAKKLTKVLRAPNPFDLLDGFDGDVDEIENLVNMELSEYPKNCILI